MTKKQMNKLIKLTMDPWFVTGFTDAEGCFCVSIIRDNKNILGWRVKRWFQLALHKKDLDLLKQIQSYFGVGNIYKQGVESIQYRVESIKDLEIIVKHFDSYGLITQKWSDYQLFKQAIELIKCKEHLKQEGLSKLVAIKGSLNRGLSVELKAAFPDTIPVPRPSVIGATTWDIQDPNWLAGFVEGEGCFFINILNKSSHRLGVQVKLAFQITQHSRDEQLIKSLIKYFDCGGNVYKYREAVNFQITKFNDLTSKVIPFFDKYPLHGVKRLDYQDWCKVAELMQNKEHLTPEGLSKIYELKAGMNKGRKEII